MRAHWKTGIVLGLLTAAAGCSKDAPTEPEKTAETTAEKAPPPFVPGPLVDHTLASVGAAVKAPDNLKLTEGEGSATFTAEGFPTVTLKKAKNTDGNSGTMTASGSRRVKRALNTPEWTWSCESGAPGDHKDTIVALCESMTPPDNPRMGTPSCEITGLDAKAAEAAFAAQLPAVETCFTAFAGRKATLTADQWSVWLSRKGGGLSSTMSTTGYDDEAKTCLKAAFDALKADPILAGEGEFEMRCKAPFSRY